MIALSTLRRTIPLAAGAVAALIVATSVTAAQAEPTTPAEEPYAAVYAANTTGGCSLDVYGWTSVPANRTPPSSFGRSGVPPAWTLA